MDKKRRFSMNTVRICVDGRPEEAFGRAYSKLSPVPLEFSEPVHMVLQLDQLFDRCGYPQAFQERRSFREKERQKLQMMPPAQLTDAEMGRQEGRCRTLDLVVFSRRQTGWQGLLMRPDRTVVLEFVSEMELLDGLSRELEQAGGTPRKRRAAVE